MIDFDELQKNARFNLPVKVVDTDGDVVLWEVDSLNWRFRMSAEVIDLLDVFEPRKGRELIPPLRDPRTRFKAGELVRPVEIYGRKPPHKELDMNGIYEVLQDEFSEGVITVKGTNGEGIYMLPAVFFEFVAETKAKAEPYSVKHNPHGRSSEIKSSSPVRTVAAFFYGSENPAYTVEEAEAAAKAECERLNAKTRTQKNENR